MPTRLNDVAMPINAAQLQALNVGDIFRVPLNLSYLGSANVKWRDRFNKLTERFANTTRDHLYVIVTPGGVWLPDIQDNGNVSVTGAYPNGLTADGIVNVGTYTGTLILGTLSDNGETTLPTPEQR